MTISFISLQFQSQRSQAAEASMDMSRRNSVGNGPDANGEISSYQVTIRTQSFFLFPAISGLLLFIFVFSIQLTVKKCSI